MISISDRCPHCGAEAHISDKTPLCRSCTNAIRAEASAEQERDYLAAYLSTRVDAHGRPVDDSALTVYQADRRELGRLVKLARRLHVDWTRPPQPMDFSTRLASVAAEFAGETRRIKRGRPATHKDDQSYLQEVA
jgi:hypothetical protein